MDSSKELSVEVLTYYGRTTIKPICEVSKLFCTLLGQKTLTVSNLDTIKKLGFKIKTEGRYL